MVKALGLGFKDLGFCDYEGILEVPLKDYRGESETYLGYCPHPLTVYNRVHIKGYI